MSEEERLVTDDIMMSEDKAGRTWGGTGTSGGAMPAHPQRTQPVATQAAGSSDPLIEKVREVFSADQSIQGPIPSFRMQAAAWFNYFDHDSDEKLSKAEVLQGLIDTLSTNTSDMPDISSLMESVDILWSMLELGDSGPVTIAQFQAPGGLWESIMSSISIPAEPRAPILIKKPPSQMRIECGSCAQIMQAVLPLNCTTFFDVLCPKCACTNRISIPESSFTYEVVAPGNYYLR